MLAEEGPARLLVLGVAEVPGCPLDVEVHEAVDDLFGADGLGRCDRLLPSRAPPVQNDQGEADEQGIVRLQA